jgi:predicted site-specific integrase-resolvase
MDGSEQLVTADQLAASLRVKRRTVILWAKQGKIPRIKISPKTIRFDVQKVIDHLNNGHRTHEDKLQSKKSEESEG